MGQDGVGRGGSSAGLDIALELGWAPAREPVEVVGGEMVRVPGGSVFRT